VTENAGEPVVEEPVVDGRPVTIGVRFDIWQRRSSLFLALALHDTCTDARRATASALAGFEDVVVLALSDRNRHASVASSVCGLADFRWRRVLELEVVGTGLLPFQPVKHFEALRRRGLVVRVRWWLSKELAISGGSEVVSKSQSRVGCLSSRVDGGHL
jgi:hypothetical protein